MAWLPGEYIPFLISKMTNPVGIELGTYQGDTTEYLLKNVPNLKLYGIDPYQPYIDWNGGTMDNPDGLYDVDDYANIELRVGKVLYKLTANWRSLEQDDQSIAFIGDRERRFELGLCPVSAYKKMIATAFENFSNPVWWKDQLEQDLWIHNMLGPYDEK
jgi:hypothetical protein